MTQRICLEQYGELPERLRVCHEAKLLEDAIQQYGQKDQNDKFAFMKGMLYVNRWKLPKFVAVRVLLMIHDFISPLLLVKFITWIQD